MSFESSRVKACTATLLIVLLLLVCALLRALFFMVQISTRNLIYFSIILSVPSYLAHVLFLIAMNGFSRYYDNATIFRNSLYDFIVSAIGAVTSIIANCVFFVPTLNQLTVSIGAQASALPTSVLSDFLHALFILWLVLFVTATLNGFFYSQTLNALAKDSGEGTFRTAALLMLIGHVLTIIIVGGLLFYVGWIIAASTFYSMRAKPLNTA